MFAYSYVQQIPNFGTKAEMVFRQSHLANRTRQTGKTTLVKSFIEAEGLKAQTRFFNCALSPGEIWVNYNSI